MIKVLDKGFITLLDSMGDDSTITDSARLSYLKEGGDDDSNEKLISRLIKYNHTSPFEQVEFRFMVKAPLFVARQWMRHRTWSYSEVSRRYTNKDIDFYIPEKLTKEEEDVYASVIEASLLAYSYLIGNSTRKEQARAILPQCMYTTFLAKTDLHNLFHFLELRRAPGAQMEIRVYAKAIEKLIAPVVPIAYKLWKEKMENN